MDLYKDSLKLKQQFGYRPRKKQCLLNDPPEIFWINFKIVPVVTF